jgi:predicted nucleic acid-binding protein
VLKREFLKGNLSKTAYRASTRKLISSLQDKTKYFEIHREDFLESGIFREADHLVEKYEIDFVDALQVVTVNHSWPLLAGNSRPLLITADDRLAEVASAVGIMTWNCMVADLPPC